MPPDTFTLLFKNAIVIIRDKSIIIIVVYNKTLSVGRPLQKEYSSRGVL